MVKCPNCGGLNSEGSHVCGACGTSLNNSSDSTNTNIDNQAVDNPQSQTYTSINTSFNQNEVQNDNSIDDNVLINAYIGNNADTLRNGTFSWCSLFFGVFYFWYRKSYKTLGMYFLATLILNIAHYLLKHIFITHILLLNRLFNISLLLVSLYFAFQFKSLYLNYVKTQISKVKNQNQEKSEEELCEICSKKGGTTIVPIVLGIVLTIVPLVLMAIPAISRYISALNS